MVKNDVIIVGSGISGLSIANMLKADLSVKILEKESEKGGMIRCTRVGGHLFHLVGGHVFNSKNAAITAWFWKHFDIESEFLNATRNAKILLNDQIIGYPIENFIYQLPEQQVRAIISELLAQAQKNTDPQQSADFEGFLKESFGQTLYDLYFGPYNAKLWNTDLNKIPLDWLDGKLPMPKIADVLLSNILKRGDAEMVHATFYYPVNNGSKFIVDRLAEGLDISVNCALTSVSCLDGKLVVNNGEFITNKLVYCGDVRKLHGIINIDDDELMNALSDVKDLLSNGTSNVLCETDENDISWLYLPENKFKAHRIIYTGNFSQTNNGETGRKNCVVEFSGKHDEQTMNEELKLLPGNLKPIAYNYEPNSYIIHQKDTRQKIGRVKKQLEKYNIYLLGRFAEWEYYNMDKCIESAMALTQKLTSQPVYNSY